MKQRGWEEEEWKEGKKEEKKNPTFQSILPGGEEGRVHKNSSSA